MNQDKGFTMTELMITLAIIGLMSAIAFPSLNMVIKDGRIKAEVRKSVDMLKVARMTALQTGVVTSVNITKDSIIITQPVKAADSTVTTKTLRTVTSDRPDKVLFSTNYPVISFGSDGMLKIDTSVSGVPTITIMDGEHEYYVEVKPSGLAHVVPIKPL